MDPHIAEWNPNGQQQQASGLRRLLPVMGLWQATGVYGGVAILLLGVAQLTLSYAHRPSDLVGEFFGSIVASEQNAARPATVATAQQMADAQATAQGRMQQQVIAAQTAQQLGVMTAMPSIFGSWFAQAMCAWGMMNDDPKYRQGCGAAQTLNNGINQQAGNVMDALGTTHAWPGGQPGAGAAQASDAAPLNQGEFMRIARLEASLSPEAVARAQAGIDRSTNNGLRMYLAKLSVMVPGEGGDDGTTPYRPKITYSAPPQDHWDLPPAAR